MIIEITKKQNEFIKAGADEVLFGGAAGGGKSFGQITDAFLCALKKKGSRQIIFRRTFPELERSIIRTCLELFPASTYKYNAAKHTMRFKSGSLIDFGYLDGDGDCVKYQSAEYDIVRFDELTHFSEYQYLYMLSRCRGANNFEKQIKSTSNPGGPGHSWVKRRFIENAPPGKLFDSETGTRIFIPSKIDDNHFLMQKDRGYKKRLLNLPEREKRALLFGDWDIFDGQYFAEFNRDVHVIKPFVLPDWYKHYAAIDYGLDMLAAYFIAVDIHGRGYVYKEVYERGLIVSEAAAELKKAENGEKITAYFAPPDLWGRVKDSGKSIASLFFENGIYLTAAKNNRVDGWLCVKEWLKISKDETGQEASRLRIFEPCVNLIRTMPAIAVDRNNPNDCAGEPHELTHAPDAIRYFCMSYVKGAKPPARLPDRNRVFGETKLPDFIEYGNRKE